MPIIIGIDCGKDGAVAFITPDGIWVADTPVVQKGRSGKKGKTQYDEVGMRQLLLEHTSQHQMNVLVGLEMSTPRPDEARMATWAQAMGIGLWKGILVGLQLPYVEVYPQVWKRRLLSGLPKGKAAAYTAAARLYPWMAPVLKGPKGGLKDGRCDALLIAEDVRRTSGASFRPRVPHGAAEAPLSLVPPAPNQSAGEL